MTSVFGQLSRSRLAAFFIIGRQRLEMKKVGVLCDVARLSMEVFCSQKKNMFCAFVETVSSSRSRRNHFARVVCRANFCCIKLFFFFFFFVGGGGGGDRISSCHWKYTGHEEVRLLERFSRKIAITCKFSKVT